MGKWSEPDICAWGEDTFGIPEDKYRLIFRAIDELKELIAEVEKDNPQGVIEECADVVIVLTQAVHRLGSSLQQEVQDKMDVNSMRSWIMTGDGVGQHTSVGGEGPEARTSSQEPHR